MKIVFFGSSKYSRIVEQEVHKKYPLACVVTVPERQSGSQIFESPVKNFADENNIPVITSDTLSEEIIGNISKLEPDFLIVADYGIIIPKKLLKMPKKAAINVHHSLLPKYRGPSPAPSAILNGEKTTGVTIMEMGEKLDTGDILAQEEYEIKPTDTTDSLLMTLNTLGAEILLEVLGDFDKYHESRRKQDESQTSYTPKMGKENGFIDLEKIPSSEKLDRMIRAYYPWPGVWTRYNIGEKKLRIRLLPEKKIQVEGKKAMSFKDFINGYKEGKDFLKKLNLGD